MNPTEIANIAQPTAQTIVTAAINQGYTPAMFANEYKATLDPQWEGQSAPGIYMANATLFSDTHFNQPLTTYSLGWANANPLLEQMLEFVAPGVQVAKKFTYNQGTRAEHYLSETDDIRAIGSEFPIVKYTGSKQTRQVQNKGLTIIEDLDEVEEEDGWEQVRVNRLIKRLRLNDFRRAVAILKAAGTNDAQTWDTTAGKDPDSLALARIVVGNATFGNPGLNRGLYGITAWQKRQLSLAAQTHAGGFAREGYDEVQLARWLGLEQIMLSREIYNTTGTTLGTVVDTTVNTTGIVLYYNAESGQSKDDPSNIKRFTSPTLGGGPFRVYRQELGSKRIAITVEHYSLIVATDTTGVQKITVS